ncbi:MAG: MFS transporter [Novosphingobium sp.]|nr:MFS transporter [Novosphingobium sp.]
MYLREFSINRQAFISACLGMGLGSALSHYTASLFGPELLAEFGWSRADFALLGTFALVNLLFVPFAGRFVDRFGTRISAIIGFSAMPLGFLAFTQMSGNIYEFFGIWVVQHIFGILTTTIVFCRVVVEKFDRARGFALSLVLTAAPFFGVISVPLLGGLIEAQGWRAGYIALAMISAVGGLIAILMMERRARRTAEEVAELQLPRRELFSLLRHPTLLVFLFAMFLVNLPQSFGTLQLKLVLMNGGQTSEMATWMMSLYAGGVIVGRLLSGLALDRIPAHLVAITILSLPTLGYVLLAAEVSAMPLLFLAIGVIGFAQGAESDIGAYLVSRRFDTKNFSLLISFMSAMVGLGGAVGSLVMSMTLRTTDSYQPFLLLAAGGTLVGAVLFAIAGRPAKAEPVTDGSEAPQAP